MTDSPGGYPEDGATEIPSKTDLWAILDMDHVLCDPTHREHLKPEGVSDDEIWDAWLPFHERADLDPPIGHNLRLFREWAKADSCHRIAIITARPVEFTNRTIGWLMRQGLAPAAVYTRTLLDTRPAWRVKEDHLINNFIGKRRVAFAVDDCIAVAAMYARHNIPVFQFTMKRGSNADS